MAAEPAPEQQPAPEQSGAAGLGDDNDSARSAADRRQAVTDALSMFGSRRSGVVIIGDNHRFGSVFGGDSPGGAEPGGPLLERITARTVGELDKVFLAPAGFAQLCEPLVEQRLLLLGTRPRWGASALAVQLLAATGLTVFHTVRFTGSPADLPIGELPKRSGLILEAAGPRALATLRTPGIDLLRERLDAAACRLVVITDADHAGQHGSLSAWRTVAAPPDAYQLLLRHLAVRLGDADRAAQVLAEASPSLSPAAFDIHRLVELACDLAEAARGRGTVAAAVERFAAGADRAVEEWLDDEVTEPADRALVLSLAVLNGMPYEAVARASRLLEQRWAAQVAAPAAGARTRRSRRERLRAARARLTVEERPTRYGLAPLEVAAFTDDEYPARILRHYWHEHDYDQELVLDWLTEVAADVEVRVATQAAIAVGYLGTFAFDTVRRDVITPWAGSGRGDERELAVAALHLPARSAATANRTVALVLDWAGRPGPAARMTAARALGGSVGAVLGEGPDTRLAKLAKGADTPLALALGDSLAELMADADAARAAELLGLMDAWSAEGRNGRQLAGVLAFLRLSWTLWTDDGDVTWPTVLWLAQPDAAGVLPPAHDLIVRLWSRALIAPGADRWVRAVLGAWAEHAERRPELREPFVRLLGEVARGERQARLLTAHATHLRTRRPPVPDTARRLITALTEGAH
ncbi:hypothetical protein [Actinoplanes sp. RD1]|uniref:hypothetical protein n=1 Tax=Actinoplanes sp. RD1 TaxID=3064538 RepID=UPI00274174CA|nr:hypothetical protein [Actinoplanes sp. RD1]